MSKLVFDSWYEEQTADGNIYYFNLDTLETQLEKPVPASASASVSAPAPDLAHDPTPEVNISDICYSFIDSNLKYFDLEDPTYVKDHKLAIDKLEEYSETQTCAKNYFKLLTDIYKKSTYIDSDTFANTYKGAINQLLEMENKDEQNLIFLIPLEGSGLDIDKSNFYFSLYFLYLYRIIAGKKLKYVYHIITDCREDCKSKKHQTDLDNVLLHVAQNDLNKQKLSRHQETIQPKAPIIVFCDDFSYSGTQIVQFMNNINVTKNVPLFLVISGLTQRAKGTIESYTGKYRKNITIFLPDDIYIDPFDNIFENVVDDIINEESKAPGFDLSIYRDYFKYNDFKKQWLRKKNMYILEKKDDKLFAVGQIEHIGNDAQSLVYLFFKYPDGLSTIQEMCKIDDYSNKYSFLYNSLSKEQQKNIEWTSLHGFEITDKLIEKRHLDYLKDNFEKKELIDSYIKENLNSVIEECNPNLHIVNLANCGDKLKNANCRGCNQCCWTPFYKTITKEEPFVKLREDLKTIVKGYYSKPYVIPEYKSFYSSNISRPRNYKRHVVPTYTSIVNPEPYHEPYPAPYPEPYMQTLLTEEDYKNVLSSNFENENGQINFINFKRDINFAVSILDYFSPFEDDDPMPREMFEILAGTRKDYIDINELSGRLFNFKNYDLSKEDDSIINGFINLLKKIYYKTIPICKKEDCRYAIDIYFENDNGRINFDNFKKGFEKIYSSHSFDETVSLKILDLFNSLAVKEKDYIDIDQFTETISNAYEYKNKVSIDELKTILNFSKRLIDEFFLHYKNNDQSQYEQSGISQSYYTTEQYMKAITDSFKNEDGVIKFDTFARDYDTLTQLGELFPVEVQEVFDSIPIEGNKEIKVSDLAKHISNSTSMNSLIKIQRLKQGLDEIIRKSESKGGKSKKRIGVINKKKTKKKRGTRKNKRVSKSKSKSSRK
jgi:hypothetical protein